MSSPDMSFLMPEKSAPPEIRAMNLHLRNLLCFHLRIFHGMPIDPTHVTHPHWAAVPTSSAAVARPEAPQLPVRSGGRAWLGHLRSPCHAEASQQQRPHWAGGAWCLAKNLSILVEYAIFWIAAGWFLGIPHVSHSVRKPRNCAIQRKTTKVGSIDQMYLRVESMNKQYPEIGHMQVLYPLLTKYSHQKPAFWNMLNRIEEVTCLRRIGCCSSSWWTPKTPKVPLLQEGNSHLILQDLLGLRDRWNILCVLCFEG